MNRPHRCLDTLHRLAFTGVLALLCIAPRAVLAQTCSFSMSNIAYGNVSTITGSPTDANGTLNVSCSGFSTAAVQLCLSLGLPGGAGGNWGTLLMPGPSGASLTHEIYTDAAHTIVWGSVYSAAYPANAISLPVSNGTASTTLTLYGRINAGQTSAPTGNYSLSFTTNDTLFWYGGYTGTAPACTTSTSPAQRLAFIESATVAADCNITAAPLAFPPVTALNGQVSATTSVNVTCVSGAPYTVALNAGTTPGATLTNRLLLLNNGTATVSYGLFTNATWTQSWGDGTGGTATNAGTGTGNSQTFTVYGRIPPQAVPPPGNYSDTITATVSF